MWINRNTILSGTSGREYTISEMALNDGTPTGTYGCSCPGWTRHGNCKHLKNRNLPSAREYLTEEVSDEQWNHIFRLIDEHELSLEATEFLDKWAMKGVKGWSAASIIIWLAATPKKGAG